VVKSTSSPSHDGISANDRARQAMQAASLAVGVGALAWLALTLTGASGRTAAIWPPNPIILACLLRSEPRRWRPFLLGGFVGIASANLTAAGGDGLVVSVALATINAVELAFCALCVRRLIGPRLDLTRSRDLVLFAGIALVTCLASAASAASVLRLTQNRDWLQIFAGWTASDLLGLLIGTPALLALDRAACARLLERGRRVRSAALVAFGPVVTLPVFMQGQWRMTFLIFAAIILVAFQADTAGVALGLLLTGVTSMTLYALGYGPAAREAQGAVELQVFLLASAAIAFPIAAAIARRNALEAKLAATARDFQLLADHSSDVILRIDRDDTILYASPACRSLGYQPADLVGRRRRELLHPDDAQRVTEMMDDLFDGEAVHPEDGREQRMRTVSGDWVWMEGANQIVRGDDGTPIEAVTQLRDVSARKAMEEELRRKRAEAEAAANAKSEFLSNMSHEIRTPLTSIVGFSGLLEATPDLPPAARTYCSRIATASQTLLSVVDDILDFSKIEAGHIELDPQPFDPVRMVEETVELVLTQAQLKGLQVGIEQLGPLPAAALADSARLRQVLLNLLTNAIKFTERGEVTISVGYQADAGGHLQIAVRDTGAGLSPEQRGKLFQRFSQADSSISRQHGGTGLGLAICKSLTELMGGTIGVESELGVGSTFWFAIAAPEAAPIEPQAAQRDPDAAPAPARILVVDDVAVNRELVRAMLEVFGHQLTEAASGAEAVERAMQTRFDLILMDLQMPGMDGLAATRAIRANSEVNAATPIVALSANVMATHVEACQAAGMDDHIGKPITPGELLAKIGYWTSSPDRDEGWSAPLAGIA
jgi:PAS domain S-box-containing protein